MKVIVLGGGVIGVTTAYYLAQAGHEVTLIERHAEAGQETTFANGGQIAASHVVPWSNPDAPMAILSSIGREDAPLIVRLKADRHMWAWGLRFLRNCSSRRFGVNRERSLRLAAYSREMLRELGRETGIAFDHRTQGILEIFRTPRAFETAARGAERAHAEGGDERVLDRAGCLEVEPALEGAETEIAGGVHFIDDESGDAHKFTQALARIAAEKGVEFLYDTAIQRLDGDTDRICSVTTDRGPIAGDAYVLATGSYAPLLARPLGLALPIYPLKGYSVTLPVEGHNRSPTTSIADVGRKVVISRLGERLRAAGTAELAGYGTTVNPVRSRAVLRSLLELFPDGGNADKAAFWAGLRPMTPDGPPILGPTRYRNLFLNAGHGTLGWTMACGSGRALADLISGQTPAIDLAGLTLERYSA